MKKLILTLSIILGCLTLVKAQSSLNDYKYVIVLNKFDFLKSEDQFQLNSLTKFLFNKYGFTAIMNNENFPEDLLNNKCLALNSNVGKLNSFLKTKLNVVLKNCKNEVIFTSEVGSTREKEYEKAYHLALRDAFKSFETINYAYKPNVDIVALSSNTNTSEQQELEQLKEEIKVLKEEKEATVVAAVAIPVVTINNETKPEQIAKDKPETQLESSSLLYAQAIDNGYQLVDSSPKVLYKIRKTGLNNVFLVEGKQAIIYKLDEHWVMEYYEKENLKQEILNVKF